MYKIYCITLAALFAIAALASAQQPPPRPVPPGQVPPRPAPPGFQPGYPPPRVAPIPQPRFLDDDDLEDCVEDRVERAFGRWVDDVDVDVDLRRRKVEIEIEVCHPGVVAQVQRYICSMPELAGFYIRWDIEIDD